MLWNKYIMDREKCNTCGATVIRPDPSGPAFEPKKGLVEHDCLESIRRRFSGANRKGEAEEGHHRHNQ